MGSSEFIGAVEEHVEQVVERCSYGEGPLLADGLDLRDGETTGVERKYAF